MTYSHEPLIVTLAQVDELICLLGSLLNFLLGLLVLHLEHSDSISEQFYIVFNPDTWQHNKNKVDISRLWWRSKRHIGQEVYLLVFHTFDIIDRSRHLWILLLLSGHLLLLQHHLLLDVIFRLLLHTIVHVLLIVVLLRGGRVMLMLSIVGLLLMLLLRFDHIFVTTCGV